MKSPTSADLLSRAARALRDEADENPADGQSDPIEAWHVMRGWHDVSRDVRRAGRRRRIAVIAGLQLAAAVVGVGAWAAVSGRLPELFSRRPPAETAPAPAPPPHAHHARARRAAAANAPALAAPTEAPPPVEALEPVATPTAIAAPPAQQPRSPRPRSGPPAPRSPNPPPPSTAPPPPRNPAPAAAAASAPDVEEVYRQAHHAHFVRRDYPAALALWDRYIAAGTGSLTLEARYNRAIALVRLHRHADALAALAPFAAGEPDGYRQQEAQSLIQMLGSSTTPPP